MAGNYLGRGTPVNGAEYMCNLPEGNDDNMLVEHFGIIGLLKKDKRTGCPKIWIYRAKETDEPKGDATVTYENPHEAVASDDGVTADRDQGDAGGKSWKKGGDWLCPMIWSVDVISVSNSTFMDSFLGCIWMKFHVAISVPKSACWLIAVVPASILPFVVCVTAAVVLDHLVPPVVLEPEVMERVAVTTMKPVFWDVQLLVLLDFWTK